LRNGAALAALLLLACDAPLESDLSEEQADAIVLALDRHGVGARKARDRGRRFRVEVATGEVTRALSILADEELPRRDPRGFDAWFEEAGLVPDPARERARGRVALEGELAETLETFDGILRARVHLAPAERPSLLDDDASVATYRAAVLLRHRPGQAVDESAVLTLLTGAVAGLDPDAVSVVQTAGAAAGDGPSLERVGPVTVSRASAPLLRALFASSLALHLLAAAALVFARARRRSPRKEDR
jgi:type III secretion protein J